ncbi:MAG: hypothetical protein AAGE96_06330 [Cyanobacteria bacterium P01_G01_bin.19]
MAYKHHTKKNEVVNLGLHPDLLQLIDIAANNEFKTRSFFIREAIAKALVDRGAIENLEHNTVFQEKLLELCGAPIAPGSAVIEPAIN